jgi:NADPH2:quinone reductase
MGYCLVVLAAWYERPGPAVEVLQVGEMPDPAPGAGEVRVRVAFSGVNPGDTKKRADWLGYGMPFPRVVPHSDGSGVIDAVGDGVDLGRVGQRVWVYGAQSYRPFGTAAQLTVVPDEQAVQLPAGVSDELGACLGIPGITAHRAVIGDGPVAGHGPGSRRARRRWFARRPARPLGRRDRDAQQ